MALLFLAVLYFTMAGTGISRPTIVLAIAGVTMMLGAILSLPPGKSLKKSDR